MSTPSHLALTSFAPETLAHVLACIACTALPSAALGNAAPAAAEATGDWVGSKTTKAGLEGFFARLLHPTSIATMRLQEPISVALLALHYITRVASRPSAFLPLTPSTLTLLLLSSLVLANKYLNDRICSNRRWARWLRAEGVTGERITAGEREVLRGLGYSLECKVDAWEGLVGQAADLAKSHELTLGQRSSNIKPVSESVAAAIRQAAQLASLQHSALAAAISVTASKRKAAQEVYPFVAAKHTQQAAAAQQALRLLYPLRVPVVPVVSVVLPGITTQQQPSYLTPPVTPEGNPSPISLYDNRIDFASALAGAVSKMPLSFQVPKMLPTPPSDGISPAIQAWFA